MEVVASADSHLSLVGWTCWLDLLAMESRTTAEDPQRSIPVTGFSQAFDIACVQSETFSNYKMLALLRKALHKHTVTGMRSFLKALHDCNLVLQRQSTAYRLITGKADLMSIGDESALHHQFLYLATTDPKWLLKYGPAGSLPFHLAFLLGKTELGREIFTKIAEKFKNFI